MEWWLVLLIVFSCFILLMLTGLPIAFTFMTINLFGVFFLWGGVPGLEQLILSIFESVTFFALLPVPLFLLMGEVLFHWEWAPVWWMHWTRQWGVYLAG